MKGSNGTTPVDVVVVGCGTTGLALARLLEFEGMRVAVVDRGRLPIDFPRATHLDDETMRAFQTLGLRHLEPGFSLVGTYRFYDSQWRPVMEMAENRGVTEQGWQSDYMFHQPDFEAVLRGHAYNDPNTVTYFGWDAIEVRDTGDEVLVTVREIATGQQQEITAAFAVGCDGANSRVRQAMGVGQIDYHATHRSLIVDIVPFATKDTLPGRDCFIQGGIRNPLTFVPIAEPRLRFELMLRPDDDAAEFERTERAYEVLSPWFTPDEYRLLRSDVYEWRSLIAEPWRSGRILLAGDAAHTMPPHLGQGMCSGIRDATNLAWKLRRVIRNQAPITLLDTYETERSPHVATYVVVAAQMANNIETMEADDSGEVTVMQVETLRPRLGPGVRAGDSDPLAGTLSAQPRLATGQLLDDAIGYRFALISEPACLADTTPTTRTLLQQLEVAVIDENSGEINDWLQKLGRAAIILTPDRYIFGSARGPGELNELADLLGSLVGTPAAARR
jgi:3-(3-hydroxy-phenyl)propionate hydroxylase